MSLELAKKALEDAQAAVDKEVALANVIKMEVRVRTVKDALMDQHHEKTPEGDILLDDCDTHMHRRELEASIEKFYSMRIIPVMMVQIDGNNFHSIVYTDPVEGQMFEVHEAMIASYIRETAAVSCKRIAVDLRSYEYSKEHEQRLNEIQTIYSHQSAIDYQLIQEYSEFIDTELILKTEEGSYYYLEFYGYDAPKL